MTYPSAATFSSISCSLFGNNSSSCLAMLPRGARSCRSFYPQSMKTCRMSPACPFCGATRPLCRHYLLQGHARTIRVCLASQILPLAGPLRRLSAIAALVQSFRTGGRLHALTQVSFSCGSCFSTACRSVVNAATFSSSCTFIPLASDHCRILRAPHHRCKEQNVRAPPVHVCFIWIWICDTVLSSRPACSLKVLSLSWNLDRNYLGTYMPVCWRPHASMFKSDVPPQDGHCI